MKVRIALVAGLLLASLGSTAQAKEYSESINKEVRGMVNHTVVKRNHQGQRVVTNLKVVKKSARRNVGKMKSQRSLVKTKGAAWKRSVNKRQNKNKRDRKTYTVKRGDNLYKVSRKTGVRVNKIIRLNRHKLSKRHDYRLKVGQTLRLYRG